MQMCMISHSERKFPMAIHLDHGSSGRRRVRKAIDAGFTSVMIDGSHLLIDQNIALTKQVVAIAKPKKITVEGEVGELQKLVRRMALLRK